MKFPESCTAILPMSAKDYFILRDSAQFRALMAEVLELGAVEFLSTWHEGDVVVNKLVTRPDYDRWVPKAARGLVKAEDIAFYDLIRYDPANIENGPPFALPCTSELPLLGRKMVVTRTISIEAIPGDETRCRHSLTGDVSIKIFPFGRMAENTIVDSTIKTFAALPGIVERYVKFKEEMMKTEEGKKALMSGRPDMDLNVDWIDTHVKTLLQTPYPGEEEAGEEPEVQQQSRRELVAALSASISSDLRRQRSGETGVATSPPSLTHAETMYYDAEEDPAWMDGEEGDAFIVDPNLDQVTKEAIQKDRQIMLEVVRNLRLNPEHFPEDAEDDFPEPSGSEVPRWGADDVTAKTNAELRSWRSFWQKANVRKVKVPNGFARFMHVLSLGRGHGFRQRRRRRAAQEGQEATPSPHPAPADAAASTAAAAAAGREPVGEGAEGKKPKKGFFSKLFRKRPASIPEEKSLKGTASTALSWSTSDTLPSPKSPFET